MRARVHPALVAFAALSFIFLVAPLIIIIGTALSNTSFLTFPPQGVSLRWFFNIFQIAAFRRTMVTSFSLAAAARAVAAGRRAGRLRAGALPRAAAEFLANIYVLPILVPEIVLGFSLMKSVATGLGFSIWSSLLIGHALLVLPYCVRVTGASLNSFDFSIEEAAVSLGCPRWRAFFSVVLPNIRAGVIAAFILAFITSINDVSISIFLTGPGISTLPIQMLAHMEQFFDPTVAAVSVLLMGVTIAVMAVIEWTLGLTFLTK